MGIIKDTLGSVGIGKTSWQETAEKGGAQFDRALAELQKLGIPTVEAQRIILESPELVGELVPELEGFAEQLDPSAMEGVAAPEELKAAQMGALNTLLAQSEAGGLTPEDEAELNDIMREAAGVGQSRDAAILQNMAERGVAGSGMELATRLKSSQDAQQQAAKQAEARAAMAFANKQSALDKIANLSGQMRTQDVGEQTQKAQAADLINQFNLQQRAGQTQRDLDRKNQAQATNLANKQSIANTATNTRNMQEQYNKELLQQQYQNQVQKAGGAASAMQAKGNLLQNQAQSQQAGFNQMVGGGMQIAGAKIQFGCFGPGEAIEMADGSLKDIEKIKVGDEVALGGKVLGTSQSQVDPSEIYNYMGIVVTKDHMVEEDGVFLPVEKAKYSVPFKSNISKVYNISTENQRIVSNGVVFGDSEMIKAYELSKSFHEGE